MTLIPAKGSLELRCNRLNIFQSDGRKIQEQLESIVDMGPSLIRDRDNYRYFTNTETHNTSSAL